MPSTTKTPGITLFLKNTSYFQFPSYNTYYTKPLYHTPILTFYILLGLPICIHFSTKTLLWLTFFFILGILIPTNPHICVPCTWTNEWGEANRIYRPVIGFAKREVVVQVGREGGVV